MRNQPTFFSFWIKRSGKKEVRPVVIESLSKEEARDSIHLDEEDEIMSIFRIIDLPLYKPNGDKVEL